MNERTSITFHQLQTFLAVARSGNLTEVARGLNTTQPTVSLQLRSLRESLGITIFERPSGRFRLTPAGEKLRLFADLALEGLRILHHDIAVLKGSLVGALSVGVTTFAGSRVLPALGRFRAKFPDVDLPIQVDLPQPLFSQVLANSLDVAFALRVRTPPELAVEPLGEEELVIIVSPQHPLAGKRRVTASELSQHAFVITSNPVYREMAEAKLRALGVTTRIAAEARNSDALGDLVEQNVGYSLLPRPLVSAGIASGRLVALVLAVPPIRAEIVAVFRSGRGASPLIEELVRFLRAAMQRHGRLPEARAGARGARQESGRSRRRR